MNINFNGRAFAASDILQLRQIWVSNCGEGRPAFGLEVLLISGELLTELNPACSRRSNTAKGRRTFKMSPARAYVIERFEQIRSHMLGPVALGELKVVATGLLTHVDAPVFTVTECAAFFSIALHAKSAMPPFYHTEPVDAQATKYSQLLRSYEERLRWYNESVVFVGPRLPSDKEPVEPQRPLFETPVEGAERIKNVQTSLEAAIEATR